MICAEIILCFFDVKELKNWSAPWLIIIAGPFCCILKPNFPIKVGMNAMDAAVDLGFQYPFGEESSEREMVDTPVIIQSFFMKRAASTQKH